MTPSSSTASVPSSARALRALVTAGAAGLGLEIARAFLQSGDHVAVCDADTQALQQLEQQGEPLLGLHCDVTDRASCAQMVADAAAHMGGIDVLVNNAGVAGPTGLLEDIDPEAWDHTVAVNLTGAFNVTRHVIPWLKREGGGAIINIGSSAGRLGFSQRSAYSATKWALVGLTKTLSIELGLWNVRVNAVLPGAVDGERLRRVIAAKAQARGASEDEVLREMMAGMSLKRLVTPQEVAATVRFLASPGAATIAGQAIAVDGDTQQMA